MFDRPPTEWATPKPECSKSPDGRHDIINGAIATYCRYCFIVPRRVMDDSSEPPALVTVNRSPRPRPVSKKGPRLITPVNSPKGTGRLAKIRALIARDGAVCFYCEHELLDPDHTSLDQSQWWPTLDHLLPRVAGGTNDLDNLVLACKTCNVRKGEHLALLVEVIVRLRGKVAELTEGRESDRIFIDHLQWELFDAGLGEMPGYTELTRTPHRKKWKRPKPRLADAALFCELGERVCANLRAENSGRSHGRTAAVTKRGRTLAKRARLQ